MMSHIFDHLMPGLQSDPERKRQESENRKKCETKLYRLLGEMVETERKYVGDLEQACRDYLPLAGSFDATQIQSLDRREMRKKKRNLSQSPSLSSGSHSGSKASCIGLGLESGRDVNNNE